VRVNHKVSTTAAASNKQGDVELLSSNLDGFNNLVIDVSICCDHIVNSTVNNGHLNGKMQTNDYRQECAGVQNKRYRVDYAAVGTVFAPAIVSVAGQIHPEFLHLLWVLADKQTPNYYALIGAEEEIGSEAFTWSRARTFSCNKNSIGKAIAYATVTRLHLSLHSTAPPARRQAGKHMSSAECLMHGAAHALQRAPPPSRSTPPRPAVMVDDGTHSVAPSAHATRAGAYEEVDVVAAGTHAASGVAAAAWLAATFGGGEVKAGGPGARSSAVVDGLCPGSEGGDTSASPSSYLLTVHDDDDDVTPLLSLQNAAVSGSSDGKDCDGVDRCVTHALLYDDAQSDDDDDDMADIFEAILGRVGQREDAGFDDDGVDVSVGVDDGVVVGVGVHCQSVSLISV